MEQNFFTVQELLLPGLKFSAPENLYVRLNDLVSPNFTARSMRFRVGGTSSFDTYFNGVSVGTLKRVTIIDTLYLRLEGKGRFVLRVGVHRLGHFHRLLYEQEVTLPLTAPLALPWEALEDGMLYVTLEAQEEAELTGGRFLTSTVPAQEVKLGAVVTHFNRKAFVVPAIARMREGLLMQPDIAGKIELIIVDNSRNLTEAEVAGATLIPNLNYGGSGGFSRGLLHLIDNGFTHCLFMDDDATCEIDSLRRAYALLRYARKPGVAVCGAQLRESNPWQLHEAGARFEKGRWLPRKHHMDMRDVHQVLIAERNDMTPNYGGWWFFAFPVNEIKNFPFPFFVRGDDVQFSLQNGFELIVTNGICVIAEDFWVKESPQTRYLSFRATMLVALLNGEQRVSAFIAIFLVWMLHTLCSYNYASAKALLLSMRHFMSGPDFFRDNMDMAAVRAEVSEFRPSEKMLPMSIEDIEVSGEHVYEGRLRRLFRFATVNGNLLPNFMMKCAPRFQFKHYNAAFRDIFLRREVVYYHEGSGTGYAVRRDQAQFFVLSWEMLKLSLRLWRKFPALRSAYLAALPEMTSEQFWRNLYQGKSE